jgi:hypothetical protein
MLTSGIGVFTKVGMNSLTSKDHMVSTVNLMSGSGRRKSLDKWIWYRLNQNCKELSINSLKPSLYPQASSTTSSTSPRYTQIYQKNKRSTLMSNDSAVCLPFNYLKVRRPGSTTMMRWRNC